MVNGTLACDSHSPCSALRKVPRRLPSISDSRGLNSCRTEPIASNVGLTLFLIPVYKAGEHFARFELEANIESSSGVRPVVGAWRRLEFRWSQQGSASHLIPQTEYSCRLDLSMLNHNMHSPPTLPRHPEVLYIYLGRHFRINDLPKILSLPATNIPFLITVVHDYREVMMELRRFSSGFGLHSRVAVLR